MISLRQRKKKKQKEKKQGSKRETGRKQIKKTKKKIISSSSFITFSIDFQLTFLLSVEDLGESESRSEEKKNRNKDQLLLHTGSLDRSVLYETFITINFLI